MSSRLEDLLHETLTAYGAAAPDDSTLLRDVRSRAARRRRQRLGWAAIGGTAGAVGAIVLALVTVLPSGSPAPTPAQVVTPAATSYALPSDGWKPGDPSLLGLTVGSFHAARINGQVCAWLGAQFRPMLWPAGYAVRLNPTALIAPDGTIVARAGQTVRAAGGGGSAKPGTPCARPGQDTWYVNGTPSIATGRVQGQLSAVGGPAPGSPRPLSGEVTATGPNGTRTVQIGADGTYSLTLPPGSYTLVGHSPEYGDNEGVCRTADRTVRVTYGRTVTADVLCQER